MNSLYFIAILPPEEISIAIDNIRKQCSLDHQVYRALKPPVHITLAPPFKLQAKMETKLMSCLETARNFIPFNQELENYEGFPSHTVYIKAIESSEITVLHKSIKTALKSFTKEMTGSFHPHITIAYRDLEYAYPKIMEEYEKKKFREKFTVNKFSLLKHDGKKWNILKEYESRPHDQQLTIDL